MTKAAVNDEVVSGVQETADAPVERGAPRRQRTIAGLTSRLKVYGSIPGYHLAWVNDDGGRLPEVMARGYEFVRAKELDGVEGNVVSYNTDPGGKIRVAVDTKVGGEPMYAYLMKQPQEYRDEDMDDLEARNRLVDTSIQGGHLNERAEERRYVPKSVGITYDPNK